MLPDTKTEVSTEAAYAAAEERALRTTRALILSEAQVLTLRQQVVRLEGENRELREQVEEVTHDAATDTEDAATDGQAHPAQDFSD